MNNQVKMNTQEIPIGEGYTALKRHTFRYVKRTDQLFVSLQR